MPSTTCGWCGRFANMTPHGTPIEKTVGALYVLVAAPFRCDYCHLLLVASVSATDHGTLNLAPAALIEYYEAKLNWHPQRGVGRDYSDVPAPIAAAASEAHECLSIGAARGAVALARAVVEAVAKERGNTKGTIQQKIDKLAEQGVVRKHIAAAAHEVRLDGNEVAHGDLVTVPISVDEAADTLALVDDLLREVYESPAIAARVASNRAKRQRSQEARD